MKKILIVNNNMHIGGVQKALLSLLWAIRDQYDITLLLFYAAGEYLKELPPEVKVVAATSAYRYLGMTKYDKLSRKERLGRSFYGALTRLIGRKYAVALMARGQKRISGYDAAISYLHNGGSKLFYGGCNDFVLRHTQAPQKITFLHCDYTLCGADTPENAEQYEKFDQIAACSQGCADRFLQAHPHMRHKVQVVLNCHRFDDILKKAQQAQVEFPQDRYNIVTVARLGKEKGVERALYAVAEMPKEKLHYYIIGDGIQMPLLRRIIEEKQLEATVTLCGMLENPYGHIRAADLLLIPSYSEAAPLVIGEAACLGTPILSTETSSAREMIQATGWGWVCENTDSGIRQSLQRLIEADMLRHPVTAAQADNCRALGQFSRLLTEK